MVRGPLDQSASAGGDRKGVTEVDAGTEPNFWWAYQTKNFSTVGETLWTQSGITNRNGVYSRRPSSELLGRMEIRDVIFHYWNAAVQAVSVVEATAVNARRPAGYEGGSPDDEGYLVRVDDRRPVANEIPLPVAAEIIDTTRYKGPLTRDGGQGRGAYIGILTTDEAHALLKLAGTEQPTLALTPDEEYREPLSGNGFDKTDIETLTLRRAEQDALRASLLADEPPRCAMCHRALPAGLLVAGHIKPRRACSEQERRDLQNVAMMICVLGCDSLYERGYIAVDNEGIVIAATGLKTEALEVVIESLAGNTCLRFNDATAGHFGWHRTNTFLDNGGRRAVET